MISKYDFSDEPKGKVGLLNYNRSKYCYKNSVKDTFRDLIANANFQHIFVSYSSEGILKNDEIMEILYDYGDITRYQQEYRTYKADSNRDNKSKFLIEYLFYLKKF